MQFETLAILAVCIYSVCASGNFGFGSRNGLCWPRCRFGLCWPRCRFGRSAEYSEPVLEPISSYGNKHEAYSDVATIMEESRPSDYSVLVPVPVSSYGSKHEAYSDAANIMEESRLNSLVSQSLY